VQILISTYVLVFDLLLQLWMIHLVRYLSKCGRWSKLLYWKSITWHHFVRKQKKPKYGLCSLFWKVENWSSRCTIHGSKLWIRLFLWAKWKLSFCRVICTMSFKVSLCLFIITKCFTKQVVFLKFGVGLNPMNLLEYAFTECTIGDHQVLFFSFHVVLFKL
jgi:hypothetical protein